MLRCSKESPIRSFRSELRALRAFQQKKSAVKKLAPSLPPLTPSIHWQHIRFAISKFDQPWKMEEEEVEEEEEEKERRGYKRGLYPV